jgi:hypothetical protein
MKFGFLIFVLMSQLTFLIMFILSTNMCMVCVRHSRELLLAVFFCSSPLKRVGTK